MTGLLDLHLPGTDGHEVLASIKNDEDLKGIPVIVMTSSTHERDIKASFSAGADGYIVKPLDPINFIEAVRRMESFELEWVVRAK